MSPATKTAETAQTENKTDALVASSEALVTTDQILRFGSSSSNSVNRPKTTENHRTPLLQPTLLHAVLLAALLNAQHPVL